jgi:drug/metabolite transporter (DMT)-like permease
MSNAGEQVQGPRGLGSALYGNAYVLLTLTTLFWGGNFAMGRAVAGHVPPVALAWVRWTLAFLILLPFAWPHVKRDAAVLRRSWPILLLLGVTGGGLFNTLQYVALNHTTALNALVINSSGPMFVALACFALFGDRISARQAGGIALSSLGVMTIVTRGSLWELATLTFASGDLVMLAAMIIWGVYTAFLRKRPAIHWLSFTLALMMIAAALNFPLFLWEHAGGATLQATWATALACLYAAIFPSVLGYIFYNRGVQLIGGNRAGVFIHMATLFGSVFSILLLGEVPRAYHGIGFALIIAGVALAARQATRAP